MPRIAIILFLRVDKRPLRRAADLYMVHLFLEAEHGSRLPVQSLYEPALTLRQVANDDLNLRGISLTAIYENTIQPLRSSVRPMLGVHQTRQLFWGSAPCPAPRPGPRRR
jgi:hypothetical protein